MKSIINKFRSNNKGDTLAIVLIGMLIVGVLGTVILRTSSVNVNMKISNLKGKQNFYYVERAVDEIYAGIGTDVSEAMENAYNAEMEKVIKKNGSYEINSSLSADFKTNYKNGLNVYNGKSSAVSRLDSFTKTADAAAVYNSLGVNISVEEVGDTDVYFCMDPNPDKIIIKNVLVKSTTDKGYESSIKTDFVIEVPDIDFSFSDASDTNLDEFFKYAVIANGDISDRMDVVDNEKGAVSVTMGTTTINGNIYAGEFHDWANKDGGPRWLDKDGIYVSGNATLNINGANIISKGAVNLDTGATINFNGEDNIPASEKRIKTDLPLRLWANDILLTGNGVNADINGDCFIKDDLEVNGLEDTVDISGSYYGFGYKNISDTDMNEADSNETPGLSAEALTATNYYHMEHEDRSAVIVNGDKADVKLTTGGSKRLILGGRAYIDLSGNIGQNRSADYMTGESISIKGNQKIYLIDNPALYQNSPPDANVIKGNPMSIYDFSLPASYTLPEFYDNLKLDDTQVVAKKVNDMVYFYNREVNPDVQTQYVIDNVKNTTKNYWEKINDAVGNMEIQNLSLGTGTQSYTVGTAMQVIAGNLTTGRGGELPHMNQGISEEQFITIVKDVRNRYGNIMYNLDDDRKNDVALEDSKITKDNTAGSTDSPYDYYIQKSYLDTGAMATAGRRSGQFKPSGEAGNKTAKRDDFPIAGESVDSISVDDLKNAGIDENATLVIELMNNKKDGELKMDGSTAKSYGVIVCTGDVHLERDFEGMIICGGDITVDSNHTFTANPELMKLLYNRSTFLHKLISGGISTIATPPAGGTIINGKDGFAFDSFVNIENWRKNED